MAYLVRADGWDYSVEAARAGAAHSYVYGGNPVSRNDDIEAAQKDAQDARRGLWGPPCFGETASVPLDSANPPTTIVTATQATAAAPGFLRTTGYRPRGAALAECLLRRLRCGTRGWCGSPAKRSAGLPQRA